MRVLIIDNYDSFTHNLFQMFAKRLSEANVVVRRPPMVSRMLLKQFDAIVFSPGPGHPRGAKVCLNILHTVPHKPVLGVCLGHQVIGLFYGCKIAEADRPMHGKVSTVFHQRARLFNKVPQNIKVGRYHSLVVERNSARAVSFDACSKDDGAVMALSSVSNRHWGVQFHPESFLTVCGGKIIDNFLQLAHA